MFSAVLPNITLFERNQRLLKPVQSRLDTGNAGGQDARGKWLAWVENRPRIGRLQRADRTENEKTLLLR